jgi:hypothetical protein
MFRRISFATLFILVCTPVALADAKVGDWVISRNAENKDQCLAVRNYVDEDDNNLNNSVVFSVVQDKIIIGLGYQAWKWDKDEKEKTSLLVDGHQVVPALDWTATAPQTLTGVTDKTDALAKAKKLSIKFDDGDIAEFDIPKAGAAMAALQTCTDTK